MWSDECCQQMKIKIGTDVLLGILGQAAAANRAHRWCFVGWHQSRRHRYVAAVSALTGTPVDRSAFSTCCCDWTNAR